MTPKADLDFSVFARNLDFQRHLQNEAGADSLISSESDSVKDIAHGSSADFFRSFVFKDLEGHDYARWTTPAIQDLARVDKPSAVDLLAELKAIKMTQMELVNAQRAHELVSATRSDVVAAAQDVKLCVTSETAQLRELIASFEVYSSRYSVRRLANVLSLLMLLVSCIALVSATWFRPLLIASPIPELFVLVSILCVWISKSLPASVCRTNIK